jgi:hypothetical protein
MKLENIISVSGMAGLYKLLATRSNGILIESFENGKRQFISARTHQFTPLVSIGIYTYTDVEGLDNVLTKVRESESNTTLPDPNDKADDLRTWFRQIVPDHDEDRVHINDIRKLIKWYLFMKLHGLDQDGAKDEEE